MLLHWNIPSLFRSAKIWWHKLGPEESLLTDLSAAVLVLTWKHLKNVQASSSLKKIRPRAKCEMDVFTLACVCDWYVSHLGRQTTLVKTTCVTKFPIRNTVTRFIICANTFVNYTQAFTNDFFSPIDNRGALYKLNIAWLVPFWFPVVRSRE